MEPVEEVVTRQIDDQKEGVKSQEGNTYSRGGDNEGRQTRVGAER